MTGHASTRKSNLCQNSNFLFTRKVKRLEMDLQNIRPAILFSSSSATGPAEVVCNQCKDLIKEKKLEVRDFSLDC